MKKLIKRLLHVVHSLLVSDTQSPRECKLPHSRNRSTSVLEGHLPVYVGEEMQRYVISVKLMNHPIFVELLKQSAQEYGYKGVLRIPCHVIVFERVLEGMRLGDGSIWDLIDFCRERIRCIKSNLSFWKEEKIQCVFV